MSLQAILEKPSKKNHKEFTDNNIERLIKEAQEGDESSACTIIEKFESLVRYYSKTIYLEAGGDIEDILQEGRTAVYVAINNFQPGKSSFSYFVKLCIKRRLISTLRVYNRQKHRILTKSFSLFHCPAILGNNSNKKIYLEIISDKTELTPEEKIIAENESLMLAKSIINKFTQLELNSFILWLEGYSYKEISETLNKREKTIDNALLKARAKLKKIISKTLEEYDNLTTFTIHDVCNHLKTYIS